MNPCLELLLDLMSLNLSPGPVSPPGPTHDPYKDLKSGADIYQKEPGNIHSQGKFQCPNAHVALAMAKQRALTFTLQEGATDMQQQSTYFLTTSCSKYLASSSGFRVIIVLALTTPYGNGTDSYMSVEDGDKSYFHRHSVSTCNFSVLLGHL